MSLQQQLSLNISFHRSNVINKYHLLHQRHTKQVVFNEIHTIGRVSLARENEAGGSWGQEVHILHVNI